MMTTTDPRVAAYLRHLEQAAAGLPPDRRVELVNEIGEHIATRLTERGDAPYADPVDVTLDRLGEPEEIVAAASDEPPPERPRPAARTVKPRRGLGGLEVAALVLLALGGFIFGVGWIVGVVLLWMSPLWSVGEKLLGTLVWPGGLAAPVLLGGLLAASAGQSATFVVGPILFVLSILAPLVVVTFLGTRASRRAKAASENAGS